MDRRNKRAKEGGKDKIKPKQASNEPQQQAAVQTPAFPEELFDKIFSYLKTTRDAHPVSNACSNFQRIMDPSKTAWAFDGVFPLIFAELNKSAILNCRRVCKQWRDGVDRFLESHPLDRDMVPYPVAAKNGVSSRPLHSPRFTATLVCKNLVTPRLYTVPQLRTRMERMFNPHQNPSILRTFNVGYSLYRNRPNEFTSALRKFLCAFGHEIWHIGIFSRDERGCVRSYQLLREVLSYLPNLKTLSIHGCSLRLRLLEEDHVELKNLRRVVEQSGLPSLPHLQTMILQVHDLYKWVPTVGELMRSYSCQVKMLHASLSFWDFDWDISSQVPHMQHLPNVTDLKLHCSSWNCNLLTWNRFVYRIDAPRLRKLTLSLYNTWEVTKLLRPLRNNIPSLTYLNLKFLQRPENFREAPSSTWFVLRNVKTLEVLDNDKVQYDHLLLHLPDLEYLLVRREQRFVTPLFSLDHPEQFEIFKWINASSIYKSNLWTRLRALKEVTLAKSGDAGNVPSTQTEILEMKTFTREVYNRLNEKQE